jgi:HPt (histidine-containing phosphotransfer) domain-containing protein
MHAKEPKLPIIDFDLGAKTLGNNNIQASKNMVAALVKMLPSDLEKIKTAFQEKDNKKLKAIAHYIKGGTTFCGTPRLTKAATYLDESIKTDADSSVIKEAYTDLCDEINILIEEFRKITK